MSEGRDVRTGCGATSSFTVSIPQSGVQSRAVTDDFGKGTSVNRCILEIYHGDQLYNRIVKPVSNKQVTFDNLRLVSSQTYDFVFWADCATANSSSDEGFDDKVYTTTARGGLKAITEKGEFVGNSDERDAFFYHEAISVNGSFTRDDITLKRPFGLLVVKTNDLNGIKDEALKPTGYTVAFKSLPTIVQRPDGRSERFDRGDLYGNGVGQKRRHDLDGLPLGRR